MGPWERLKLSPFQKWKYYGLPPWKFFIAILLIISSTVTIYQLSSTLTPYQRAQTENWEAMLIPDDIDSNSDSQGVKTTYLIYTVDEFMACLSEYVATYYALNTTVVGNYEYLRDDDDNAVNPIVMTVTSYEYGPQVFNPDVEDFDTSSITSTYYLMSANDTGPFQNASTRLTQIHSLIRMTLQFDVKNLGYNNGYRTCYVDTVHASYEFYYRGRIELSMQPSIYICTEQYALSLWNRQYISLVICLGITGMFSAILQILHFKAVYKHISLFQLAKSKSKEQFKDLTWSEKMEFFNFWFLTTSIANVSNIIGCIYVMSLLLIASSQKSWNVPLFFIGLGCMFSWISSIQFFEYFPNYYSLILTLRKSAPRVLAFLVGVTPVFLGFAYFGVAYFSTGSSLFSNVDKSSVALFALLNGDVIHDVFDNIYPISPVLSRIYLYVFISLFIYAVLNIFIAIVEDAFFAAKQEQIKETKEDAQQHHFAVHDLDVVGLVAGPPIPITGSMIRRDEDSRMESLLGSASRRYQHPSYHHQQHHGHRPTVNVTANVNLKTAASLDGAISELDEHDLSEVDEDDSLDEDDEDDDGAEREDVMEEDTYGDIHGNMSAKQAQHLTSSSSSVVVHRNLFKPTPKDSPTQHNELTVPLISSLRHSQMSRSERLLLQTNLDPTAQQRQHRHDAFFKILRQLLASHNQQFLADIQDILFNISTDLRPPHSFDHFPCGFKDCIYCHLKTMLQANLTTLRDNVGQSIKKTVHAQTKPQIH